jgi:hypothetical protein
MTAMLVPSKTYSKARNHAIRQETAMLKRRLTYGKNGKTVMRTAKGMNSKVLALRQGLHGIPAPMTMMKIATPA